MNKVNFNSLTGYKAPESWLEKAAAVPESAVKRKVVPIYRVVAAASIVLVSAVGVLMFVLFGNHSAPVAVYPSATESAASVTGTDGDIPKSSPTMNSPAVHPTVNSDLPTDEHGQPMMENLSAPTEKMITPTSAKAERTAPTQQPTNSAPTPAQNPVMPTSHPDEAHTAEPTQPPVIPTDIPLEVEDTERDYSLIAYLSYGETVEVSASEDPAFFCRYYDASGTLLGSGNLYAAEKRATLLSCQPDGTFEVTYDPVEKGIPIGSGRYQFVFYDSFGTELSRGNVLY